MSGNKASSKGAQEIVVVCAVILISVITLGAVLLELFSSAIAIYNTFDSSQPDFERLNTKHLSTYLATNLGVTISAAGLSAIVICLLLRLRDYDNDLVTPPALTGPIVVVALGAALTLGGLIFA